MRSRSLLKRAVPAFLAAGVALAGAPAAALSVNAVLLYDDPAPGFAAGPLYQLVNAGAAVNDLGQVVFRGRADFDTFPQPQIEALFFGTDRSLPAQAGLIMQEGDTIMGAGGLQLRLVAGFNRFALDNSGRVVIPTTLDGAPLATNGAFVEDDLSGGPTSLVHRNGDPIAPTSGVRLDGILNTSTAPSINNAGALAFGANLSIPAPTQNDPDRRDSGRGYIVNDGTSVNVIGGSDPFGPALLRKEREARTSPFPGHSYPTGSVTGMPSAV